MNKKQLEELRDKIEAMQDESGDNAMKCLKWIIEDAPDSAFLPYPENKPEENVEYLVTLNDGTLASDTYENGEFYACNNHVINFMKFPE